MDRFQEQTLSNAAHMLKIWEGPDSLVAVVEPLFCQSCGEIAAALLPCTWDETLLVGKCCAELPEEECACRFAGEQADASDCPVHGYQRQPAALPVIARVPVQRAQGELFGDVPAGYATENDWRESTPEVAIEDLLDWMPDDFGEVA